MKIKKGHLVTISKPNFIHYFMHGYHKLYDDDYNMSAASTLFPLDNTLFNTQAHHHAQSKQHRANTNYWTTAYSTSGGHTQTHGQK